jgi:FAD dependent oxidoreductase TIGR03364
MYSRDAWASVAASAAIPVQHHGAWILCRRPQAVAVAQAFLQTGEGQACTLYRPGQFAALTEKTPKLHALALHNALGLLHSPHELRLESPKALPILSRWLQSQGVRIETRCRVAQVEGGRIHTTRGTFAARQTVLCTGAMLNGIAGKAWQGQPIDLCTLQMIRIEAQDGFQLPGAVLTDESLARYPGWSCLPECQPLKERLQAEQPQLLEQGVHFIAVQDADGSIVAGDSHRYGDEEFIGSRADIDEMILGLATKTLNLKQLRVRERWTGVYPRHPTQDALIHRLDDATMAVLVTSGTGASTAFGIARDTLDHMMAGSAHTPHQGNRDRLPGQGA